jgi:hypothetical protein
MKRIKMFYCGNESDLEDEVNKWLQDGFYGQIFDIKYQFGCDDANNFWTCLIIFEPLRDI